MKTKVETYMNLLKMKDSGVKFKFQDVYDEQICQLCIEEELIDEEIAYLYKVDVDEVRNRRHKAYLHQLHVLQEKLLQEHFVVLDEGIRESQIENIKSEKAKEIIKQIHLLSNTELDQLLDYLIINNKRLSKTIVKK